MTAVVAGLVAALVLLTAVSANADSDGYYCVGRGYIAYEVRSAITPGVADAHVLRTVRFGPAVGALGESARVVHHARFPGQPFVPPTVNLPNLGLWLRPGHVPLPSSDPAHTYRLALNDRETRDPRGGILHRVRSELQRIDRTGAVVARLVLYDGERFEVVH